MVIDLEAAYFNKHWRTAIAAALQPDLTLDVDYQSHFGTVDQSTPEFIVSRLVANASDRRERTGFEVLVEAVGEELVQQSLFDAQWSA